MPSHVLVTGGLGYIGSVLCEHLLSAGNRVTALDNVRYGQISGLHLCANERFSFVRGDSRDESIVRPLLKDADVIIPLAAVVGAPACDADVIAARTINVDAIRMLLKLRSPQQLLLYPNTNSGYGTKSVESFCTEDSPLEPITLYGRTKVEAEQAVLDAPHSIAFRLATVFGTSARMRLDLLVNHFVYVAVTDGYIVIFERHFKRNYVHVRDVADCFLHAMGNAAQMVGRPFNLGLDAANLSKAELAEKIRSHVPKFCIEYSELRSDPDKRNYIVSNQRLREAGFEAKRDLDHGIEELMKAYRMLPQHPMKNI
ncbi:MAG TPA: NAD(P)-dependent oxidoreductase [Pirellulales bacterium]|nr:NAD(P)-dependent oxidoreductase [Pirellulales bacterium]